MAPMLFHTLLSTLSESLFPSSCIACGRLLAGAFLCEPCSRTLPGAQEFRCPACHARTPYAKVCVRCRPVARMRYFMAAGSYHHPVLKAAITALKYQFVRGIAPPLGKLLAETVLQHLPRQDALDDFTITAVPLHGKRLRWRGFNHAELVAQECAAMLRIPLISNKGRDALLVRVTEGMPQATLAPAQRWANIAGAFRVRNLSAVERKRILLVDDVLTTGATLFEAARTLHAAGAREIWGAVVAQG